LEQETMSRTPREALALDKARHCEIRIPSTKGDGCARSWLARFPSRSKRIDVVSRIIFPLIFGFFNLAYWSTYLTFKDGGK
jgi:anionic glutamate receptor